MSALYSNDSNGRSDWLMCGHASRLSHSNKKTFVRRLESSTKYIFFYLQLPLLFIYKMRESEHSEFYYPDEQEIVTTGGGDDKNENNNNKSQQEIENFLKEQKSANTARIPTEV